MEIDKPTDVADQGADFTDQEWESIVSLLGPRHNGQPRRAAELDTKRRAFNAVRYKLLNQIPWGQLPARYGDPHSLYQNHRSYESYLYEKLYLRSRTMDLPPRVAEWLEMVAGGEGKVAQVEVSRPSVDAFRLEERVSNLELLANKCLPLAWKRWPIEERIRNLESILERFDQDTRRA